MVINSEICQTHLYKKIGSSKMKIILQVIYSKFSCQVLKQGYFDGQLLICKVILSKQVGLQVTWVLIKMAGWFLSTVDFINLSGKKSSI